MTRAGCVLAGLGLGLLAACRAAPEDGPFDRALRKHAAGNLRAAVDLYLAAVARDPGDEDAWFNLGDAWEGLGNAAEARRAWERAVAINPRATDALCNLALLDAQAGDRPHARTLLERAAAAAPHRAYPLVLRARLEGPEASDYDDLLAEALEREPNSALAHLEAARAARRKNDKAGALEHARRAFDAAGTWGPAAVLLAETALWAGAPGPALLAARRLAGLDPDSPRAFALLARAYRARGMVRSALWAAMQAQSLAPGDPRHAALVEALLDRIESDAGGR